MDSLLNHVKQSFASGLDFNNELLADSGFVEIFEHNVNYYDDVITLLNRNEIDTHKAYYCVLGMQSLDVDKYVRLCNIYLTLFDHIKISQGILETAIAPNFFTKSCYFG